MLRGDTECTSSNCVQALYREMHTHYGAETANVLLACMDDLFQSLPVMAKLRGAGIASSSALACVEGADVQLK